MTQVALRNLANAPKNTCLRTHDFCRIINSLSVSCGGKWGVFWSGVSFEVGCLLKWGVFWSGASFEVGCLLKWGVFWSGVSFEVGRLLKNWNIRYCILFHCNNRQIWGKYTLKLRTSLFWVVTQRVLVISYRHFGTIRILYKIRIGVTSFFWDSWTLRMGPVGCPETSGRNYSYLLRNNPEEWSF